jgi:hypothetical protein
MKYKRKSSLYITIKVWEIYNGKIEVVFCHSVWQKVDHWCHILRQEMRQSETPSFSDISFILNSLRSILKESSLDY